MAITDEAATDPITAWKAYGFSEADHPPSEHGCGAGFIDSRIEDTCEVNNNEIVVLCYECMTFWRTGTSTAKIVAHARYVGYAERMYG